MAKVASFAAGFGPTSFGLFVVPLSYQPSSTVRHREGLGVVDTGRYVRAFHGIEAMVGVRAPVYVVLVRDLSEGYVLCHGRIASIGCP